MFNLDEKINFVNLRRVLLLAKGKLLHEEQQVISRGAGG